MFAAEITPLVRFGSCRPISIDLQISRFVVRVSVLSKQLVGFSDLIFIEAAH